MCASKYFPFLKLGKAVDSKAGNSTTERDLSHKRTQFQHDIASEDTLTCEDEVPSRHGLHILVSQPPTKPQCVDIIAIHGLNGHYQATWTDRTTGANWLKDPAFLSSDIPYARIQSFGYNSVSYFSRSNANIRDFASELLAAIKSSRKTVVEKKRPIVFICHSLGGIVFKQAVVRAHEQNQHYSNILENIKGVAFFGTPHQGSDLAFWDHIGTTVVRAVALGYSTNTTLSKDLKIDSTMLKSISESFSYRGEKMRIRSFYETESMKGLNCRVVDRSSSILNWPNEIDIAASANHSTICKFPVPEDSRYQTAWDNISQIINGPEDLEEPSLTPAEQSCLWEFNSGYESHLSQVDDPIPGTCTWILNHETWLEWDSAQRSSLLWITADAGCGKSVIAKHLINYHKSRSKNMRSNLCYFFFKDGFEQQDNAQSALSAILHQIYCFQPTLLKHAMAKYTTTPKRIFKQFSCLYSVLMSTVEDQMFRDTICILDGLDECESKSRDMLVKELAQYFNTSPILDGNDSGLFKVVILSRPDNLIQRRLELFPEHAAGEVQDPKRAAVQRKFRLMAEDEVAAIARDVKLFVRAKIDEFGPKSELSEDVLAQVENKLIQGADFTFLWVSLVIKLLEDAELGGISREQMESILKTTDLDEVYSRLLSGRKYPLKARKILYIVLAAVRPLSLEEMCVAVEIHQDYYPREPQEVPADAEASIEKLLAADNYSAGPLQSHGKVLRLDYLSGKLCKPFGNHLRLLCGHFLRIRANKIYLVHQTARKFLLDSRPTSDFSVGFWLRSFGWNTERLSAAEIEYLQERKTLSYGELETWEHSIRMDVATRYLLQVCVDYIQLFETVSELAYKAKMRIPEYIKENDDNPEWAFLTYASVYWVEHYRESRKALRNCFDFLFEPRNVQFTIWTSRYRSWTPEEESKAPRLTGMPIHAQQHRDIGDKLSQKGVPYNKEEEFQRILDYFNLGGVDTEIYDEEYVDGDRYWKEQSKARDEDDLESESPTEERLQDVVPDRIQHFRRKHRNEVQEEIRESWNPMSAGSMNPTSIKSIDAWWSDSKEKEDKIANPTLTFRKQDISSPHGMGLDSTLLPRRPRRRKKKASETHSDLPAAYDASELSVEDNLQKLSAETNVYAPPHGGKGEDPTGFWDQGWFQEDSSER